MNDFSELPGKIAVQQRIGVPYPIMTPEEIQQGAREQALKIAEGLVEEGALIPPDRDGREPAHATEARELLAGSQMVALVSYLQKLGQFEEVERKDLKQPWEEGIKPNIPDKYRLKPGDRPVPKLSSVAEPSSQ